MNLTNLVGTVTAGLTILSGIMASVLKCEPVAEGAAKCTASFLPPEWAAYAAAAFGVLTLILKLLRPGGALHSLFGSTAVVVEDGKGGPGVVTNAQVKSPSQ
jgi:hypothetical protein